MNIMNFPFQRNSLGGRYAPRLILIALIASLSACSSGSTSGKPLSELRASCDKGKGAACRQIKQHDAML